MGERLQKVLAKAGLASRRQAEEMIKAGRVSVNGQIVGIGVSVLSTDEIRLDGRRIHPWRWQVKRRVLMYHKPVGEICTRADPENRPSVFQKLPRIRQGRWVAVGRLDINSEGLMLFTTDGELANALMHPSREVEREYAVRVFGEPSSDHLAVLQRGVSLEDGLARFDKVVPAGGEGRNVWFHVVLKEGKKREVRRMWESLGYPVSRLIRIRYGPIAMPRSLHLGQYAYLEQDDLNALLAAAGIVAEPEEEQEEKRGGRKELLTSRSKRSGLLSQREEEGRNRNSARGKPMSRRSKQTTRDG